MTILVFLQSIMLLHSTTLLGTEIAKTAPGTASVKFVDTLWGYSMSIPKHFVVQRKRKTLTASGYSGSIVSASDPSVGIGYYVTRFSRHVN